MSVKVKGGGLRALADMSTKNVIIFYGRLPLTCPPPHPIFVLDNIFMF